jgi:hypothetical protein
MKPLEFRNYIRNNSNKNKRLKSSFVTQYLGKFSEEELKGLMSSFEREINSRQQGIIDEKISFLSSLGYDVIKQS